MARHDCDKGGACAAAFAAAALGWISGPAALAAATLHRAGPRWQDRSPSESVREVGRERHRRLGKRLNSL